MSTILETIKTDFLNARKAREQELSSFLSSLVGDIESKAITAEGRVEIEDKHVIEVLKSYEKRVVEFLNIENIATALKEQLEKERSIITKYLPTQLNEDELRDIFSKLDKSNLGLMMAHLKENFAGLYDGKLASAIAKEFI